MGVLASVVRAQIPPELSSIYFQSAEIPLPYRMEVDPKTGKLTQRSTILWFAHIAMSQTMFNRDKHSKTLYSCSFFCVDSRFFDGPQCLTFEQLVTYIRKRDPGKKVPIAVRRYHGTAT
jgi:hypothetical protein